MKYKVIIFNFLSRNLDNLIISIS